MSTSLADASDTWVSGAQNSEEIDRSTHERDNTVMECWKNLYGAGRESPHQKIGSVISQ